MILNYTQFLLQITICFLLSSCIGIERQYRRRVVGLRTIILVSLGAFLFVRFSFAFPESDMTRVAAQVAAGIGFIGAGVILKDGRSVKGLTTAATLWCSAAIGILCAGNLLFEAAVGTLIILFTNIILRTVNSKINNLSGNINYNIYSFSIICEEKKEMEIIKILKKIVIKNEANINSIETSETDNGNIKIDISITDKKDTVYQEVMKDIPGREDILSISLNKKDFGHYSEEEE